MGVVNYICMNKKVIIGIVIALIVVAGYAWYAQGREDMEQAQQLNKKVFRIGIIESLSGSATYYGEQNKRGVEVAKQVLVTKYPELQLELVHEDSLYTPKGGVDAYQKIAAGGQPHAVVTHASPVAIAVQPLAKKDGVLQVATSSSAPSFSTPDDVSVRVSAGTAVEAVTAARYIKDAGYKRVATLAMNNEFGKSMVASLKSELGAQAAPAVVGMEEYFPVESGEFRSVLAKIKQAQTDVLYVVGLTGPVVNILKQAKEIELAVPVMSFRTAEDPALVAGAGVLAEGLVYTYAFDPAGQNNEHEQFVDVYKNMYGTEPDGYAAEGYEGLRVAVELLRACGTEQSCIKRTFTGWKDVPSVFGPLNFDANGDVTYQYFLKTVKDGKFVRYTP